MGPDYKPSYGYNTPSIQIVQFDDMSTDIKDGEVVILIAPVNAWNNSYSVCRYREGMLVALGQPFFNLTAAKDAAKTIA